MFLKILWRPASAATVLRSAAVMHMDNFMKGAVLLASPMLRRPAFAQLRLSCALLVHCPELVGPSLARWHTMCSPLLSQAFPCHFCWSPQKRTGQGLDSASESLAQLVASEAEVWRRRVLPCGWSRHHGILKLIKFGCSAGWRGGGGWGGGVRHALHYTIAQATLAVACVALDPIRLLKTEPFLN